MLSWDASPSESVAGYRVYFGTAPGHYLQSRGEGVDAGAAVAWALHGLLPGTTYYFAVTAYGADGSESAFSNEASKQIP
jgi:hypothetical protein